VDPDFQNVRQSTLQKLDITEADVDESKDKNYKNGRTTFTSGQCAEKKGFFGRRRKGSRRGSKGYRTGGRKGNRKIGRIGKI
jgi:hypothetical protein